ncbi:MAG: DUF2169 domain-containing protein [Polyangiales bacterium]
MSDARMELLNDTPWALGWFAWRMAPARDVLVVVLKATWSLQGPTATPAAAQRPLCGDVFADDDPTRELVYPSDLAPFKPRGEVIALGSAHAPGEGAARAVAAFRVGRVQRGVAVLGDRAWTALGVPGEPAVFRAMPLSWRRAYGGPGHRANPAGVGLARDAKGRLTLPNLEDPGALIEGTSDRPEPAGVGPVSPHWPARASLMGTYDHAWRRARWPLLAEDLSWDHFLASPPGQRAEGYFRGDEEIELRALVPGRTVLSSALPGRAPRVFVDAPGGFTEVPLRCDTVLLHGDDAELVTVWRGMIPLADPSLDGLAHIVSLEDPLHAPRSPEACHARFVTLRDEALAAKAPPPPPPPSPEPAPEPVPEPAPEPADGFVPPETPQPAEDDARARFAAIGVEMPAALAALLRDEPDPEAPPAPPVEDLRAVVLARYAAGEAMTDLDLTRADLSGLSLRGINFTDTILTGANLSGTDMRGAVLRGAVLVGAVLHDADIVRADATGADFSDADARRLDARASCFDRVVSRNTRWTGSRFDDASLIAADFSHSTMDRCRIVNADLERINLTRTLLDHSVMRLTDLTAASLAGASAREVDFRECMLAGLQCGEGAMLEGATFNGAMGPAAVFDGASLAGASLAGAKLPGASFTRADLTRAKLDHARLREARFDGARLEESSFLGADLMEANLADAAGRGCDLRGASLFRANLQGAALPEARTELADLRGTVWEGA